MWPALILVYAVGLAVTASSVLRNQVVSQGYLVNTGAIVLWPVYWSLFLTSLFLNRTRRAPGRPSK